MNFSTFASNLLSSTAPPNAPLFHSTRGDFTPFHPHPSIQESTDDILGASHDSQPPLPTRSDRRFSISSEEDEASSSSPSHATNTTRSTAGGPAASFAAIPAFVSRLGGRAVPGRGGARGWKAHESVAAPQGYHSGRATGVYSDEEETDDEEEEEEEGPLPGAFVSQPVGGAAEQTEAMDAALLGRRTLFVYPVPGPGGGVNSRELYRDSGWIAAYGAAVLVVGYLAFQAWWHAPPLPPHSPSSSLFSTIPTLSLLSLISVIAGASSLFYILAIQHSLATLLTLSVFGGPLLFAGTGVVAFAGSFSSGGVAQDGGWKAGVRWLAVLCFVAAFILGRTALSKRKQLQRAISVGEVRRRLSPL